MDTDQKTESLATLCADVEKNYVRLPEFQRDFVWEIQKTYDLFDSFVKGIFVGSLIYGIPSFDITVRDIDTRPRTGKGSRKKLAVQSFVKEEIDRLVQVHSFRLLLDGQQRVTSIYRTLLGFDTVFMVITPEEDLSEVVRSIEPSKRTLDQVLDEFRGDVPPGRVGIKLNDVYRILRGEMPREADLVAPFMASANINFSTNDASHSPEFVTYITQAKNLEYLFRQEKLVSYYLLNTDQDKFALFFERSNSKGIQLSFIDILAAKLYKGFNLRQHVEDFKESYPHLPLNREALVRALSYIVSSGRDTGRAFILSRLTFAHFNEQWSGVTELYRRSYEYLVANHMIIGYAWMPYENMLIPLMMFLRHIPHRNFANISERQRQILHLWYWLAIMSRRYSSAAQTYLLEDARVLEAVALEDFTPVLGLLRKLVSSITSIDDLRAVHKQYDAVYKGVLNLINYQAGGLAGWESGAMVSATDDLDDHHIFPKDYLKKTLKDSEADTGVEIDCVVNRCLIPKLTNLKAGNKAPSAYLGELEKRNSRLAEALRQHLVPAELIDGTYDDLYEMFLEDRGKAIMSVLEEHVFDVRRRLLEAGV